MLTSTKAPSRAIENVYTENGSLFLKSVYGTFRVNVMSEDVIRVTYAKNGSFSEKEKPGMLKLDLTDDWNYKEDSESVSVFTDFIRLEIDKNTSLCSFYDNVNDSLLYKDYAPADFEEYSSYVLSGDKQQTETIKTADGEKTLIRDPQKECIGKTNHITVYPVWEDEALYGLGQHEEGYGSLRGQTVYMHQANRKIAVPMLVSTKGYGILFDCYSPLIFNDTAKEPYVYIEAAPELDFYFIHKNDMKDVIKGYRFLTGKAAMLPKWAFGYLQSEERYENEEQILDVMETSRQKNIGLDCVVLDWISWEDGKWGQKTVDKRRFPNLKKMTDTMHQNNTHFMISVWPSVDPSCDNFKEFTEAGQLLKASNVYNALSKEAREIYWKQLNEELWPGGVDAWWCDSSEPITPEWSVRVRPEASANYHEFQKEMGLRLSDEMSNSFCLFHAMGIYDGQRGEMAKEKAKNPEYKEKRVCNLTRSAFTGQQRLGTIMWSGDIEAKWSTFRNQLGAGLNFCASGLPYWTTDVGAFFVHKSDFWYWNGDYEQGNEDLGYRELYTRWYQWECFLPVFRCHGTDCHRELWHYGKEGDMFYDALVKTNHLRYELMPYIYSEVGKVWKNDASLISNLAFSFAEDKNVWDITDQYMFGESMMVCPVTEPMYYEKESRKLENKTYTRKVYLPEGTKWFDFYTKEEYEGGQWIETSAEIDKIPVFVKNNSIIPMTEFALSTAELNGEIEYAVYSDSDCSYEMYSDDGDGYGYENGEYTVTLISATKTANGFEINKK